MKSIAAFFFASLLGIGPNTAHSKDAVDFQKIGDQLTTTMLKCPERVWPELSWRNTNVLMSAEGDDAYIWRGTTGKTSLFPAIQVPTGLFDETFSFLTFEGKRTISFNLEKDELEELGPRAGAHAFRTIVHEGFHHFTQRRWFLNRATQRGTLFPVQAAPRILRRMLYENLKDYFLSGEKNEEALAKAAYWNEKWKSDFPAEFINSMDSIEGTARYVELVADLIAGEGCDVREEEISSQLINDYDENFGISVSPDRFELDLEGYDVGSLASFILRFKKTQNWEQRVMKGSSPIDLALENVAPQEEDIPDDLSAKYKEIARDSNQEASSWLQGSLPLLTSQSSIRIVPNEDSFQSGSFSPKGFLILRGHVGVTAIPLARGVEFSTPLWKLSVDTDQVLFEERSTPCRGRVFVVVPQSGVTIESEFIQVRSEGLRGSMSGKLKVDADGLKWFCEDSK